MIIKVCKQCYRVIAINLTAQNSGKYKKSVCLTGNLPELYNRMVVNFELHYDNVTDYEIKLTDKNKAILEKNGVDTDEYERALRIHKELKTEKVDWYIYKSEPGKLYRFLEFGKADRLHKVIYNNATDKARLNEINRLILKKSRFKHTPQFSMDEYLKMYEDIEANGAYEKLPVSLKIAGLSNKKYGISKGMVYDSELVTKQKYITANIEERVRRQFPLLRKYQIYDFLEKLDKTGKAEEQLNVLDCLTDSGPCIITGKAGTGKTTVIKLVIDCYANYYGQANILLITPTGKASRRLAEKTGMPASTIHRALRKKPDDDFVYYNRNNPLPHKVVIIDESSMIDTLLMYDLLNAVHPMSKIIFAGDHNQLPPVGCGEPFFDFLKTLPVNELKENHRQAEDTEILDVANGILEGKGIYPAKGVNVTQIPYNELEKAADYYSSAFEENSYQIISPYNALNELINNHLKKGSFRFNVGDKIIMLRNTKEYCNGDIGYIKSITTDDGSDGITSFRSKFHMQIDIEGNVVNLTEEQYGDLELAYAITVHKMQGSECDNIVVVTPKSEKCISNVKLMYTAATRARKELDFVLL